MTKVLLTVILPLLLPTALYVLWALGTGRGQTASGSVGWRSVPWLWLAVAGAVLAAAMLVTLVQIDGARNGVYVPPHVEDGKLIEGHVEPAPKN